MVLKPEPFVAAIRKAKEELPDARVIALCPGGRTLKQSIVEDYAHAGQDLIFVCGHYEGFDERIFNWVDEKLSVGDYVVTEAGFGADLGAEKFYNIKCRKSGLQPKLTIIVATAQGLKMHGGVSLDRIKEPNMEGLKEGFGNLDKHVRNLRSFGQQVIVAFNRFASDTDEEVEAIRRHCEESSR